MLKSLLNNCNMTWNTATVTSSTSRSTPLVDMSNFHSVCFCLLGSTLSGSSKITAHIQAATANSTASLKTVNTVPISSSTAFGAPASRDYKVLAVDCPVLAGGYRYWRMRVQGSTGILTQDKFLTIQYNGRKINSTAMMTSTSVGPSTCLVTCTTY